MNDFMDLDRASKAAGISRSTLYRYEEKGYFPKRKKLRFGRIGWNSEEVKAWRKKHDELKLNVEQAKEPNMKHEFEVNECAMPITFQQFQDLTNEILVGVNKYADPHFLNAEYLAQIVMSALHAYDHKTGYVKKSELLESCINRVSCHVTYAAVAEIQKKQNMQPDEESDDGLAAPVIPITGNEN